MESTCLSASSVSDSLRVPGWFSCRTAQWRAGVVSGRPARRALPLQASTPACAALSSAGALGRVS